MFFPAWGFQWDPSSALSICDGCPVAWICLSEALDRGEREGVWGGFDFSGEFGEVARRRKEKRRSRETKRRARERRREMA